MNRGFTLLEVLISVAIFLLIAGGIFEAVSVTMKASNDIALARLDSERLDSFQRFLRLTFTGLPQNATMELRIRQGKERDSIIELLLNSVPGIADFSRNALETGGLSIGAVPDHSGAYTISLANYDSEANPVDRDKTLEETSWLPILPGVKEIHWRFAAADKPGLQETWDLNSGRPVLIDLELTMLGGDDQHFQFAIPPIDGAPLGLVRAAQPFPTPTPAQP